MRYRPWFTFLGALAALPAAAADIVLTPPSGSGVSMTDAVGSTTRFRVGGDGVITMPGLLPVTPTSGLCLNASGQVGTCSISAGGTVTSVTAGTGIVTSPGTGITTTGSVGIDTAVVPRLGFANTFTAPQSISNGGSAASVVLAVQGAAAQTGNLQEWRNSAGTAVASIGPAGTWGGPVIAAAKGGTGLDTSASIAQSLLRTTGTGTWGTLPPGVEGQVLKIVGGAVAWGTDSTGSGGGGTVTSLGTSAGSGITLSSNPITTTGTIAADTAVLQSRVSGTCALGSSIRAIAANGTVTCQTDGPANAFVQGGNALTGDAVVGTTNAFAVNVHAGGLRVMRYEPNAVSPNVIGGHPTNSVTAGVTGAMIGGGGAPPTDVTFGVAGGPNRVTDVYGTVGGGFGNRAGSDGADVTNGGVATVSGGYLNTASGLGSIVGGGYSNAANSQYSTVGGGYVNTASGDWSMVGGGFGNGASGSLSTVGGGENNTASGSRSAIGGGGSNFASGLNSTIPGGFSNSADGEGSFVAGSLASAIANGQFVWSDKGSPFRFNPSTTGGPPPNQPPGWASPANTFSARATGGVWFVTGVNASGIATSSVYVNAGSGTWLSTSDRAAKENFEPVDSRDVLARIAAMPIAKWNYIAEGRQVRHLGPTSQDFRAAFGLGPNDKTIATVDADGVALAAIQGLHQLIEEKDRKVERLTAEIEGQRLALARQRELIAQLQRDRELQSARMEAIERAIGQTARVAAAGH